MVSSSGHAAHPDDIIASCQALQSHLKKLQDDAGKRIADWEKGIQERELAEKRRVAPGWLDSDARILEPEKTQPPAPSNKQATPSLMDSALEPSANSSSLVDDTAARELDRAFGGMSMKDA